MIRFKIENKTYEIPTTWDEVKFLHWIQFKGKITYEQAIQIFTGIEDISNIDFTPLVPFLFWMQNDFDPNVGIVPEDFKLIKIREKEFGKKILLHEILKEKQNKILCYPDAISIYLCSNYDPDDIINIEDKAKEIMNWPVKKVYATGKFIMDQFDALLLVEHKTLSSGIDPNHIRAGIDIFNEFGAFCLIDTMANGDITKHSEVQRIEYDKIYLKMLLNLKQTIFQKNLTKILNPNS